MVCFTFSDGKMSDPFLFQDFHPAHPRLMRQTFGPILLHLSLPFDYVQMANNLDDAEVEQDVSEMLKKFPHFESEDLSSPDMLKSSAKHYLTMKKLIKLHNLDSLAVRCWPELPNPAVAGGLDHWCYLAIARLASDGFPVSCEGDVDGALGCMIAKFLGCGVVYLSDWLEHDEKSLTLWHGGMAPVQLSEPFQGAIDPVERPTISRHFNTKKPGCLQATIRAGMEVTVFRFWVYDNKYHLVALEGIFKIIKPAGSW